MNLLSKVLIVIALATAIGFTFHRVNTCRIAFATQEQSDHSSSASASDTERKSRTGSEASSAIYPTPAAERALMLGYQSYEEHPDGSIVIVPLPPTAALATTVQLATAKRTKLQLRLADSKCEAPVVITAYRADQNRPIVEDKLFSKTNAVAFAIDVSSDRFPGSMLIEARMDTSAANNWNCNVVLSWK